MNFEEYLEEGFASDFKKNFYLKSPDASFDDFMIAAQKQLNKMLPRIVSLVKRAGVKIEKVTKAVGDKEATIELPGGISLDFLLWNTDKPVEVSKMEGRELKSWAFHKIEDAIKIAKQLVPKVKLPVRPSFQPDSLPRISRERER